MDVLAAQNPTGQYGHVVSHEIDGRPSRRHSRAARVDHPASAVRQRTPRNMRSSVRRDIHEVADLPVCRSASERDGAADLGLHIP